MGKDWDLDSFSKFSLGCWVRAGRCPKSIQERKGSSRGETKNAITYIDL